jgi:hypothetical protein
MGSKVESAMVLYRESDGKEKTNSSFGTGSYAFHMTFEAVGHHMEKRVGGDESSEAWVGYIAVPNRLAGSFRSNADVIYKGRNMINVNIRGLERW